MNFKKLPKEKRNQLILVIMITVAAVGGLYLGLIKSQKANLSQLAARKVAADKKYGEVKEALKRETQVEAEIVTARQALAEAEVDIASGDLYAWVINKLREFKAGYTSVDIPQFSQLGAPTDVNLFPTFPYKQATLTVAGTAYFHDVGKFLADLENRFPHMRAVNLSLDATPGAGDPEKLSFKVDLITLVKNTAS
jgi:hypothetical protein